MSYELDISIEDVRRRLREAAASADLAGAPFAAESYRIALDQLDRVGEIVGHARSELRRVLSRRMEPRLDIQEVNLTTSNWRSGGDQ